MKTVKACSKCRLVKKVSEFSKLRKSKDGLNSRCKKCERARYRANRDKVLRQVRGYREKNRELRLLGHARRRAKERDLPFSITRGDIEIPGFCPVLGIKLEIGRGGGPSDCSPTLDRLIPELGYVPGNVEVISWRANKIKGAATAKELLAVAEYYNEKGLT